MLLTSIQTIMVTGGCGFIGSNVVQLLLSSYPHLHVINVDKMDYNSSDPPVCDPARYTLVEQDVAQEDAMLQLLQERQVEAVLHFAAQSHVDRSFDHPQQFVQDNVVGTLSLLQAARRYGQLRCFLHFSTDEVYGDNTSGSFDETSCFRPTNPYSASKAGAELMATAYHHSFRLPLIIVRCNNVYGPRQYRDKLIPRFLQRLRQGVRCPIHGSGEQKRSFVHVYDVYRAVVLLLERGVVGQAYNIGSQQEYSVIDVLRTLLKVMHLEGDESNYVEYVEDRPYNDQRYWIRDDKLRALGWSETEDFVLSLHHLAKLTEDKNVG